MNMDWISTTIKKVYMDKILSGEKRIEFKGYTPYWKERLDPFVGRTRIMQYKGLDGLGINFLCGRLSYKYQVIGVYRHRLKEPIDIAGKKFKKYYTIHLGVRIS